MELPHWLMATGSPLLVVGLVGVALDKNARAAAGTDNWEGDQTAEVKTPTNPPSAATAA